jgi:hypothetical protein
MGVEPLSLLVALRACLGLLCSRFFSSAPRTPPWSSSTVEFVEQVLLHKNVELVEYPLRYYKKNVELASSSTFFLERSSWS